jgi:hypothetical protein
LIEREWVFPARNSGKIAGDMVKRQKKKKAIKNEEMGFYGIESFC